MATYTDNYQLTKPTYAEQADIGVINSNMNIIDDIMHSSQVSLAPAYDQSQTYAEGDVVMYELLMYKCISPTTGAWDGSKWERTTASESGGGGSAELDILGEGNGAVVSFADGASAELAKCIAEITPKQDLHGYDKPWAGGAGKNIFGYEESATDETATYRANINQRLIISKVTENEIKCNYNNGNYSEGYLVISGIDGTLPYSVSYTIKEKTVTYNPDIIKDTTNSDSTKLVLKVRGNNGGNVVGDTEYVTFTNIQVESGTSITSFEPYSNICPISGSTSVTVTVSDGETSTTKTAPLGQTVYGGQLNVLTGELTIDRGFMTITSESQLTTFTYNAENGSFSQVASDGKISNAEVMCISNMMEGIAFINRAASAYVDVDRCYSDETGKIRIRNRNSVTINTKADLFARFEGAEICYFLATPQTVQLTPQEVNSLLGQNNISADTGDIDIVYVKASAPIQPNPTGTPTATLKKLGIEGTVFEVEGGGGGSSSGINYSTAEQKTGQKWIDGKDIYQITIPNITLTSNITQTDVTALSIDNIIDYKAVYRSTSIEMHFLNEYNDGADRVSTQIYLNKLRTLCTKWFITSNFIANYTIQYTKITD